MNIRKMNTSDLMASITSLYAYRSASFEIAMSELRTRITKNQFSVFCKVNAIKQQSPFGAQSIGAVKMTLQQLANHYGITLSSVKKWSPTKRAARMRDAKAGVLPHIHDLISELAGACYRASCYIKSHVEFSLHNFQGKASTFQVYYRKPGEDKSTWLIEPMTEVNTANLSGAIAKVEELCK